MNANNSRSLKDKNFEKYILDNLNNSEDVKTMIMNLKDKQAEFKNMI